MEKEDNKSPPIKRHGRRGGRPGVDWSLLYSIWAKQGKTRRDFLREYGIDLTSPACKRHTQYWSRDAKDAVIQMHEVKGAVPVEAIHDMWQIVQTWRSLQAKEDYQINHEIRDHLKSILREGYKAVTDERGGERQVSNLKPSELARLAEVAFRVQQNQRLSLGMSSENIGVILEEPNTHIEKEPEADNCPLFEVFVNKNGKFVHARPKRIS